MTAPAPSPQEPAGGPSTRSVVFWGMGLPAALLLAGLAVIHVFGGYQAVRLRGFTQQRVSDLGQAEQMAPECVGLPFGVAKRAFNDENSWILFAKDPAQGGPCDYGRLPAKGSRCQVWMYRVDSGGSKIMLFVEDDIVVGAAGN